MVCLDQCDKDAETKGTFFFSYIALTNFNYDKQEIKLIGCFNSEACQESIDNLS